MSTSRSDHTKTPVGVPEPPSRGGVAGERAFHLASLSPAGLAASCADTMVRATGSLPRRFAPRQLVLDPQPATPTPPGTDDADAAPATLTGREIEVLDAASSGASRRAVGQRLHISEATVSNHLSRIYKKLGVTNRMAAVAATTGPAAAEPGAIHNDLRVDRGSITLAVTIPRDGHPARSALTAAVIAFARETGSRMVPEGPTTEAELLALRDPVGSTV